jgi:hypothetical protein
MSTGTTNDITSFLSSSTVLQRQTHRELRNTEDFQAALFGTLTPRCSRIIFPELACQKAFTTVFQILFGIVFVNPDQGPVIVGRQGNAVRTHFRPDKTVQHTPIKSNKPLSQTNISIFTRSSLLTLPRVQSKKR